MTYLLPLLACLVALNAEAAPETIRVTDLQAKPQVVKILQAREAEELGNAFDNLPWDNTPGTRCHTPGYRLERLSDGKVVLDATICFACDNVRYSIPAGKGTHGFSPSTKASRRLQDSLKKLLAAE
jgi:hypothetical protein